MYTPPIVPTDVNELPGFLGEQLTLIATALSQAAPETITIQSSDQEPPRPANGMLVYFPAVDFDPGSGTGLYFYNGSTWNFII